MSKISKSPERNTFQRDNYVRRKNEKDEAVSDAYIDMFDKMINEHTQRFNDPEHCKNNMEYDLVTTSWILEKARANTAYAQNIYAAICNNDFQKLDVMPILKDQTWCASWRSAGGIVADMRQQGDYIDWYCSGIGGGLSMEDTQPDGYVPEGCITDEVRHDLQRLGWAIVPGGEWEKFKKENEK
jgi:hypothetical protein